ncbi:hypothetical protein BX600DRAFT_283685 [Xylariales sp. PMI_506]|nr:hypothetical protein BX600DRAFT_283685 [Xylariales sp. PMI_506]
MRSIAVAISFLLRLSPPSGPGIISLSESPHTPPVAPQPEHHTAAIILFCVLPPTPLDWYLVHLYCPQQRSSFIWLDPKSPRWAGVGVMDVYFYLTTYLCKRRERCWAGRGVRLDTFLFSLCHPLPHSSPLPLVAPPSVLPYTFQFLFFLN